MTQGSESSSLIHPTLHHFGVVTRHLEKMVEWYAKVVGMVMIYQSSNALGSKAVVSMSTEATTDLYVTRSTGVMTDCCLRVFAVNSSVSKAQIS